MKKSLFLFIIITLSASALVAQPGELALHLFGGVSLPTGDFGTTINEQTHVTRISGFDFGGGIGLAKPGLAVGGELIAPVWFRGLQWVFSARALVNGVDGKDALSAYQSQFVGDTVIVKSQSKIVNDISLEFGRWLNLPVMTGFRYDHHFSHKYTLYGIIQTGVNLTRAPSFKATVEMVDPEGKRETYVAEETKYKFAKDFGYEVGIGFVLNQTYNLGFRYMSLSAPRYDGTKKLTEEVFPYILIRENDIIGEERPVSMFVVTLGIQLFR